MRIEKLTTADTLAFEQFFHIYASSLPLREQKTKLEIKNMYSADNYIILLASETQLIGFSIIFVAPDNSVCLLEYMAIAEEHRRSGYGSVLFLHSYHYITEATQCMPMLIELDSVRENCPDLAFREKRQQFYLRLGCQQILGLDYILPLPSIGQPPAMDLLLYQPDRIDSLPKHTLRQWLIVIYQQVYQ